MKLKPGPGPLVLSRLQLLPPHVFERQPRVRVQIAGGHIINCEDQSVENGLCPPRFSRLRVSSCLVGIERLNFVPHPDALGDVVQKLAFRRRGTLLSESRSKGGPGHGIGRYGVTGDAKRFMIAGSRGPAYPPA